MRDFLLVIHILAVGAWIGANVTQFLVTPRFRNEGGAAAAAWMGSIVLMGRLLYTPAAILVLLSGVWLVLDSDLYEFEHAFVAIGFATVIAAGLFGALIFGKRGAAAAEAFAAGDDARGKKIANSTVPFAIVDMALVVIAVTAMVGRWGV